MEKAIYPLLNMRITQGYNEGSHAYSYAIDDAGLNSNIENIRAPFTGTIKKIYKEDANEIWLESNEKVEYADKTIDYMTVLFAHNNDVSNLYVGKVINQGEIFYKEGNKGNATGNHCHIECGKGKFIGSGWSKNNAGYWSIINGKKPEECFFIDDKVTIINNHGYNFKKIEQEKVPEKEPDINNSPSPTPKLIFTCPKTAMYAIKLEENNKLYLLK